MWSPGIINLVLGLLHRVRRRRRDVLEREANVKLSLGHYQTQISTNSPALLLVVLLVLAIRIIVHATMTIMHASSSHSP
jgi:hypothetical protein